MADSSTMDLSTAMNTEAPEAQTIAELKLPIYFKIFNPHTFPASKHALRVENCGTCEKGCPCIGEPFIR